MSTTDWLVLGLLVVQIYRAAAMYQSLERLTRVLRAIETALVVRNSRKL